MGVASGCGCKEVFIFLIPIYFSCHVSVLFVSSIPTFCSLKKIFFVLVLVLFVIKFMYYIIFCAV